MIDSDRRPVSNRRPFLKSASTDVIYLKSQSDLTASFPNSQICGRFIDIKSTYLSERKICCYMIDDGQVCTSSALHIISNECKNLKVPGINP